MKEQDIFAPLFESRGVKDPAGATFLNPEGCAPASIQDCTIQFEIFSPRFVFAYYIAALAGRV
jgi:hypothetical protein